MDKNTTTGLILIGAVVMAFMFLNKPRTSSTKQVVTSKSKIWKIWTAESSPLETKSEIDNLENLDSNDLVIYQKLKEQQQKDLIERFGVFFTSAEGNEKSWIQNNKIKLSFSSKGARIASASMVEVDETGSFKYKTYEDFVNKINQPLLFLKKKHPYELTLLIMH